MMWITLLRRFWPFALGAVLVLGLAIWHGVKVKEAHRDGYEQAKTEYEARERKKEAEYAKQRDQADAKWQQEMGELRARALSVRPAPIRLCVNHPSLPEAGGASGADDPATGSGHGVPDGDDISPELVRYAVECEHYRRQLKAMQEWAR